MECMSIEVEENIEVQVSETWKLILSLLGGILLGVLFITVVYYSKRIQRSVSL